MRALIVEYPLYEPRASNTIRAVSWNTYCHGTPEHADAVLAALKKFDCDILLLSELSSKNTLPTRIHDLGYGGVYVEANYRKILWPIAGGMVLFSRFPIESYRIVKTSEDGIFCVRRYYIEARLRISSNWAITVGMTHHSLPWESAIWTSGRALMREVSKNSKQFLFFGDLNALPSFPLARKLLRELVHLGPPLHLPSHPTGRWAARSGWEGRIDYAFATHDVAQMLVEARFGESFPSDHRPIVLHLKAA